MAAGDSSEIDVGKLVAGGFAVVTAPAGIVGGLTGGVARFIRNDSERIYWSLGAVLLAIFVALAASQIPTDEASNRDRNRWVKAISTVVAFILFAAASWITVDGLTRSLRHSDLPRIGGTWKTLGTGNFPVLTVSVKLTGMRNDDFLNVTVRPGQALQPDTNAGKLADFIVYKSQTGADADGTADLTFDVALPVGYVALQVVANLGPEAVTCDGRVVGKESQNSAVITTATPDPQIQPTVYSCMTLIAPTTGQTTAVPTPTPSST